MVKMKRKWLSVYSKARRSNKCQAFSCVGISLKSYAHLDLRSREAPANEMARIADYESEGVRHQVSGAIAETRETRLVVPLRRMDIPLIAKLMGCCTRYWVHNRRWA